MATHAPPLTSNEAADTISPLPPVVVRAAAVLQPTGVPEVLGVTETTVVGRANFSFVNRALKVLLVQCVRDHDAHIAPQRKNDAMFSHVLETFITNLPCQMYCRHNKPSVKTLRDKFDSLMKNRKEWNTKNEKASGISEEVSDVGQLLDDLLLKRREHEEEEKKEKYEVMKKEKRLVEAGESIKNAASKRKEKDPKDEEE